VSERIALLSLQRYDGRLFSALTHVTLSTLVLSHPPLIHFSSLHTDAVLPEKTWNMFYVPLETFSCNFIIFLLVYCAMKNNLKLYVHSKSSILAIKHYTEEAILYIMTQNLVKTS
jgi:hypothetical protein